MKYLSVVLATAALLLFAAQGPAWAKPASTTTMGESGNPPPNENAAESGGAKRTTGPKGQLDQGKTDCNNCDTSGPGNK